MTFNEKILAMKPYVFGAITGAIVTIIVGFSAGWVVTTGTMTEEVKQAKVSVLAEACLKVASSSWTEQGKKLASLDGWTNDTRKQLASNSIAPIEITDAVEQDVIDACDDMLRDAS